MQTPLVPHTTLIALLMKCIEINITNSIRNLITDKSTDKCKYEYINKPFSGFNILTTSDSDLNGTLAE